MAKPPTRPKLGDYGLANHRGHLTHTFRPGNPAALDIKSTVLNGLRDKQFDGTENMSLHEHLSRFAETCEFCVPPATVTESQKRLRLFPFTLTGKARDWLIVYYQRQNPYYNPGFDKHPNLSYSNNNTLNPLLPNPQQQQ